MLLFPKQLASSYVSRISETAGLLANEQSNGANYNSVEENSTIEVVPETYTDSAAYAIPILPHSKPIGIEYNA